MIVRDLMFVLGELELSGKGDAEVNIYCDGYVTSAAKVFIKNPDGTTIRLQAGCKISYLQSIGGE